MLSLRQMQEIGSLPQELQQLDKPDVHVHTMEHYTSTKRRRFDLCQSVEEPQISVAKWEESDTRTLRLGAAILTRHPEEANLYRWLGGCQVGAVG